MINKCDINEATEIDKEYDLIVVGSGFCGSVIARLSAEELNCHVLVMERRNHLAGNMYDETDEDGFLIQKYGPHVFHTSEDWIYDFIKRFSKWYPYKTFYGVDIDKKFVSAPFGFQAIRDLYPKGDAERLIRLLKEYYPGRSSVSIVELMESKNTVISDFAKLLYEKDYKPYAAKQWNLEPQELDRSVLERLPIILSDRKNYFDEKETKYELQPEMGYTKFFENMLTHEKIDVALETDIFDIVSFHIDVGNCACNGKNLRMPIIYTGALEDFFENDETLPYRSLYFEYKKYDLDSYQPTVIMTYPQRYDYLRTTEYSKMMRNAPKNKTVVAFEYPIPYDKSAVKGNEPYYPILTKDNIGINQNYMKKLRKIENLYFCGRLADYKYYDMDKAIIRAFEVFNKIKGVIGNER